MNEIIKACVFASILGCASIAAADTQSVSRSVPGQSESVEYDRFSVVLQNPDPRSIGSHEDVELIKRGETSKIRVSIEPPFDVPDANAVAQLRIKLIQYRGQPSIAEDIRNTLSIKRAGSPDYYLAVEKSLADGELVIGLTQWDLFKYFDTNESNFVVNLGVHDGDIRGGGGLFFVIERHWLEEHDSARAALNTWSPAYAALRESGRVLPNVRDVLATTFEGGSFTKPIHSVEEYVGDWQVFHEPSLGLGAKSLQLRQAVKSDYSAVRATAYVWPSLAQTPREDNNLALYLVFGTPDNSAVSNVQFEFQYVDYSQEYYAVEPGNDYSTIFYREVTPKWELDAQAHNQFGALLTAAQVGRLFDSGAPSTGLRIEFDWQGSADALYVQVRTLERAFDELGDAFWLTGAPETPQEEFEDTDFGGWEAFSKLESALDDMPHPTSPQPSEIDHSFISNRWDGMYTCQGTPIALTLMLRDAGNGAVAGTFYFGPTQVSTQVPDGSYTVTGRFTDDANELILSPGQWVDHPEGYGMVGLTGKLNPDRTRIEGQIDFENCEKFWVQVEP